MATRGENNYLYVVVEFKNKTQKLTDRFDTNQWSDICVYDTKEDICDEHDISVNELKAITRGQSYGKQKTNKIGLFIRYHDIFVVRVNKFHIYTKKIRDAILEARPQWQYYRHDF